jgi:hypothetical protein
MGIERNGNKRKENIESKKCTEKNEVNVKNIKRNDELIGKERIHRK